jgi:hypothetical protein
MKKSIEIKATHVIATMSLIGLLSLGGSISRYPFIVHADTSAQDESASSTYQLLDKYSFGQDREADVSVIPQFKDGSTNIIFYRDDGGGDFEYFGESNDGPYVENPSFANYPGVIGTTIGDYVAVEFYNDGDQFTCAALSLSNCLADSHFISQTPFEITDDSVPDSSVFPAVDIATTTISNLPQLLDALSSSSPATSTSIISATTASSTDASSTDATSTALSDSEAIQMIDSALASSTATATSSASSTDSVDSSDVSATSSSVMASTTIANLPQLLDALASSSPTTTPTTDTFSTSSNMDTSSSTLPDSYAVQLIDSALASSTATDTVQ